MNAQHNLARLRVEDPRAAAAVVDALWEQLAREDARMFAALWRKAQHRALRTAGDAVEVPPVQWLDEPLPAPVPVVADQPAPVPAAVPALAEAAAPVSVNLAGIGWPSSDEILLPA